MNSIEICISFIVAILGVAYPILLQVASNLGEKYDSVLLVSIFKKEWEYKIFKYLIYVILNIVFLYVFFAEIIQIINVSWLIILMIIFTSCLIISFLLLIRKILIYYNRNDLTSYLIDKDKNKNPDLGNNIYFESISELLYWSIKNQNEHIAKTANCYFYDCFQRFREKATYSKTGYPEKYYEVAYKSTLELLRLNDNKLKFLENHIPGGIWLLGEFVKNKIPEETYSCLWINLRRCIDYKRDDIVLYYWQNASQYFTYSLQSIDNVDSNNYQNVIDKTEIEEREKERNRFLEFNYALGGLLTYQQRYDCIHRLFRFTQSEPPEYILLPQTMRELFDWFFKFMDGYSDEIAYKYSFLNTEGMGADGVVRKWVLKYIAILFLRQYTLLTYYTYQQHVAVPLLPNTQRKQKFWLNYIDYFKKVVLETRSDKELMKGVRFDLYGYISDEWCRENDKLSPVDLFEQTRNTLISNIEKAEREQEPSAEKVEQFKNSTNRIISRLFDCYNNLKNSQEIEENYHSWYTIGVQTSIDKSAFVDNQDVDHINFDAFLAEDYAKELNYTISQQFYFKKTKSYLFDKENLFKSIDYLKIKNPNNYIIIAFGLHIPEFEETIGLDIVNRQYNEFEICEINGAFPALNQSLVIIKKTDLPYFNHLAINPEIETKYELSEVNSQIKLYASVVDLNRRTDLWNELPQREEVDLRTQVLLRIELSSEFRWKKDIELIQIKLFSIYEENGIPNKLKDIRPINS